MTIRYPAALDDTTVDSLPDVIDLQTAVSAVVINRLRDAIISIESELGVNPSGVETTVRNRLDNVDLTIQSLVEAGTVQIAGDLGGTNESPLVIGFNGNPVNADVPSVADVMTWDGAEWGPAAIVIPPEVTPGGSNTQLQFHDAGVFNGDAGLTYDKTTKVLSLTDAISIGTLPAQSGLMRFSNLSSGNFRNSIDSADLSIWDTSVSDQLYIGTDSANAKQVSNVNIYGTGAVYLGNGSTTRLALNANGVVLWSSDPVIFGNTGASDAGMIRLPYDNNLRIVMAERNLADDANYNIIATSGIATTFGDVNTSTIVSGYTIGLNAGAGGTIDTSIAGGYGWYLTATGFHVAVPVIGDVRASSPLGVHGVGTQAMADADQAVAAAIYVYNTIVTTDALSADRALVLPAATDVAGYTKIINNTCTGGFNVVVGDGGAGTTVSIADGETMTVLFDSRGATRVGIGQGAAGSFTAGGDLTGSSSSQQVVMLTGDTGIVEVPAGTSLAFGTTPAAASGDIRFSNAFTIFARNAADDADVQLINLDASDNFYLGNTTNVANARLAALTSAYLTTPSATLTLTDALLASSAPFSIGATPATAGDVRLQNASTIQARNVANDADIVVLSLNATDDLALGNVTNTNTSTLSALTSSALAASTATLVLTDTLLSSSEPLAVGTVPSTAGSIRIENAATLQARNVANDADVLLLEFNATDDLLLGNTTNVVDASLLALTSVSLATANGTVTLTDTLLTSTEPLAFGAVPALTGMLRFETDATALIPIAAVRNAAADDDISLLQVNATDDLFVGIDPAFTDAKASTDTFVGCKSTGTVNLNVGADTMISCALDTVTLTALNTVQNGITQGLVTDVIRTLHTADDTEIDIYTWTIQTGAVTTVDVLLTAISDDGTLGGSYKRTVTFRESGGVVLIGTLHDNQSDEDAAGWDADVDDDGAGGGRIRVTGDTLLGVTWYLSGRIQHVLLTP